MKQFFFYFLLCFVLLIGTAFAQDEPIPIAYGETIEGEISDDDFEQEYIFAGTEGDVVTITMAMSDGDLDSFLRLLDADGEQLNQNDDSTGSRDRFDSRIFNFELPETADYLILASRFGGEEGNSTGTYTLTLERRPEGELPEADFAYGETVEGEISNDEFQQVWTFVGTEGDRIHITMLVTSEEADLDSLLIVQNEQGQDIAIDSAGRGDEIGEFNAEIVRLRLPEDGLYTIVASRYGMSYGDTEGSYEISLELLGAIDSDIIVAPDEIQTGQWEGYDNYAGISSFSFEVEDGMILNLTARISWGNNIYCTITADEIEIEDDGSFLFEISGSGTPQLIAGEFDSPTTLLGSFVIYDCSSGGTVMISTNDSAQSWSASVED